MNKHSYLRIIMCVMLAMIYMSVLSPVSATCIRKLINSSNTFTSSNIGTSGNDLIICETDDLPNGRVEGRENNDRILIFDDDGIARDIWGDGAAAPGDDFIVIFDAVIAGSVVGDYDTTGGLAGDDQITVYGNVTRIRGDEIRGSGGLADTGGNDVIDLFGTTTSGIIGDGIYNSDNAADYAGDDVITVHEGATSTNVYGDVYDSISTASGGGDDIIIIAGTVLGSSTGGFNGVYGDWMRYAGTGGNDTILVTSTGQVGTANTSADVLGDYYYQNGFANYGGADDILIEGIVYGSVFGDYIYTIGGADDIVVGVSGNVRGDLYGDYIVSQTGINGADYIILEGNVDGDVKGDGYYGNGGVDSIVVETFGDIGGSLYGDGTLASTGGTDGATDSITIKGQVAGNVLGDGVAGNGATDAIVLQGRTTFTVNHGAVEGNLIGDGAGGNGAKDYIVMTPFSQVRGGVYGDNVSRTGGNGGDDHIVIDGNVGTTTNTTGVYGDGVNGDGGNDFLHIEKNGIVYGSVIGDYVNGIGGEDLIWIDGKVTRNVNGDNARNGNVKDQIAIRQGGIVQRSVYGDGTNSKANGGWDTMNIIGGLVNLDFVGDNVDGNGGSDFMAIRMNGQVGGDFIGDDAINGGNDTMSLINGIVSGDMIGDGVSGDGGDDKMNILVAGTVTGNLIGDKVGTDKSGGNDSIFVAGTVGGRIYGDHASKNAFAGKDTIQTSPSAVIGTGIYGDNAKGAGKNDTFKINGKISSGGIRGDVVNGKGGNDTISIFSLGTVSGNVIGDDANGAGGNDTIFVDNNGKVTGNIWGDFSTGNGGKDRIVIEGTVTGNVAGDYHKSGSTANGGDDTIIVEETGLVQGSVFGDDSPNNGGDDKIDIKGRVNGHVLGDKVGGAGGNDVIRIFASGVVGGNVCGKNNCTTNPGDNVVFLDESATPSFDYADTIIIAGKVLGNVIAGATYGNSDDTVVVVEGAEIGGTVYAGDEIDGDSFIYVENIINEEKTISEVVNSVTEKDGKVTVNGVTYTLDDVESVSGTVGQIACFGMDYRMNKASDGCSARSQSEKDAIQWHLNNPGNDGRLPGLEGCAVYPYGNALRVYEIMDGAEGDLVAEIWGDILIDVPENNELLGATADGNIALYHLTSGELQIECKNIVDGKTQVRVLSDLAGTVTSAFDKS